MKEFIQNTLHLQTELKEYKDDRNLPLYLRSSYRIYQMEITNIHCLLMRPTAKLNLSTMRKNRNQLNQLTGQQCVLGLDALNQYTRDKMIEEGIPFILSGKFIYMPFLGIALHEEKNKRTEAVDKISFMTQKVLLTALYQRVQRCSVADMAKRLDVSIASITRSYDEISALDSNLIVNQGTGRYFIWDHTSKELYQLISSWLRNPVKRQYRLDKKLHGLEPHYGGVSALSKYTMLADNVYPTFAITKDEEKKLQLKEALTVPQGEEPDIVIQVVQYILHHQDATCVDPVSAILSLTEEEKNDPRIDQAIEQLLEEQVW